MSEAEGHRIVVAEIDGALAGVLHVFERPALEKPREAVVQALVVDADRRSSGIGEVLMREAERWARTRRLGSVALYTRTDRKRARRFYERIGYRLKATSHLLGGAPPENETLGLKALFYQHRSSLTRVRLR